MRAYLRGRLAAAGLLDPEEFKLYSSDAVSMRLAVAFAVGVAAKRRAPILSAAQLDRAVRDRIDLAAIVNQIEGGNDPGSSSPPPPVAPVPVLVSEETARVEPRRWIGDPLPATGS